MLEATSLKQANGKPQNVGVTVIKGPCGREESLPAIVGILLSRKFKLHHLVFLDSSVF